MRLLDAQGLAMVIMIKGSGKFSLDLVLHKFLVKEIR